MKTRQNRTPFALHPLSLAALVALAGPALALPTGGVVVGGTATIAQPNPTTQVITQGTNKAIIDWTSFSIASGERVRIDQPSSSAVILNRVTGYDPSKIFGSLESNGRVFLLNPYGVVFGASARVDVGGLMASTLSLSNADFNAGRLRLTSNDGSGLAVRGEVRNEGVISAPGGTVVLAGPSVSNTGTIDARGGRVGMAAVQDVLVDVEGDGLIFFQASATEASNRLAQLGRIQADGGSVELRAIARGAFADTVLNMGGVVQARAIGVKEGRVVIDGGSEGITRVAGTVDASGAGSGERGGNVSVRGEKVLLDLAAVLDASGHAGGGKVTVGGDWQGQGSSADLGANAAMTHVAAGARIDVRATGSGNGGTAVVWADDATRYYGAIDARGGTTAGDGGKVEVSGKQYLDFAGEAQIGATHGRAGELLLDPADITISAAASGGNMSGASPFEATSGTSSNLSVTTLNTLLAGAGTVRVNSGGAGTAGNGETGSITVASGAAINGTGTASLRLESAGAVTLNSNVSLSGGGSFSVTGEGGAGRAGSFTSAGGVTISTTPSTAGVAAGNVSIQTNGDISLGGALTTAATASGTVAGGAGGNVTLSSADGNIVTQAITTSGANADANTGAIANRRGGNAGTVTIEVLGTASADRTIDIQGAVAAAGGRGGDGLNSGNDAGVGGNGGAVSITNGRGSLATLAVSSRGGDGGDGRAGFDNNNDDGGVGGTGGTGGSIQLSSTGAGFDTTVGGAVTARGGNGGSGGTGGAGSGSGGNGGAGGAGSTVQVVAGASVLLGASTVNTGGGTGGTFGTDGGGSGNNGTAGANGANAAISINAGTNFAVTSALSTTGGTGNAAIALSFGQAGGGGTLDLGAPGQLTASSLTMTGGAGTDTLVVALPTGAANLTLTDAELTMTGLPTTTLSSINAANVTGGSGSNTINVAAFTGNATIAASAGTDGVTGNGANTSFVGPTSGNYAITGERAGSVGGTTFSAVGTVVGGSGDDTFTLGGGVTTFNGTLDGGGGANTLTLTDGTNAIAVSAANAGTLNATTAFAGIGTVNGGSGADTFTLGAGVTSFGGTLAGGGGANALTLTDGSNTVAITAANTGTLNGTTTFSGIGALTGGSGADSVTLGAGVTSFAGSIDGGGGANSLAATNGSNTFAVTGDASGTLNTTTTFSNIGSLAGGSGADSLSAITDVATTTLTDASLARTGLVTIALSGIETATLGGGAGANAIVASGFTGSMNVLASAGNDSVTGNGSATTLTGTDNASAYAITAANAGTLTEGASTTTFTGVNQLNGGTAADTFTLGAGVTSFAGTLAGGGGSNTLALTDGTNTVAITGANAGTLNGSTDFSGIAALTGGSGSDTLAGTAGGTAFAIGGANAATAAGIAATSIEALSGGAGADSFTLGAGVASFNGSIAGGGGTNTLTLTDGTNAIGISGANSGSVNTTTTFTGIDTVNGGSGAETFTLAAGVGSFAGTLAGGGGSNTLALTDGTNTVAITGANAGTLNGSTDFSGIAALTGGSGSDTLAGTAGGTAFAIGGANAATAAGIAATSIEALSGGAGADSFTLGAGVASFNGSIAGGGGTNTLTLTDGTNAIAISGANAGSVNTTTNFTGITTLAGGAGTDTLTGPAAGATHAIAGSNAVSVAGVGASSIEALAGGAGDDTYTLGGGVASFVGTIDGGGGNNTLGATNGANAFAVTGANSGTLNASTSFTNIGNLAGGSGGDGFVIGAAGTLTGTVNGGTGSNTLDLSAKAGALVVAQSGSVTENGAAVLGGFSNIGTLAGNGTNTELIGSVAGQTFTLAGNLAGSAGSLGFTGVTRLTGAGANDTLVVADDVFAITLTNTSIARAGFATIALGGFEAASLSGGAGFNIVDASGFGGTAAILASAGGDLVTGNGANTTLVGPAAGTIFTVSGADTGNLSDGTFFSGVGNLTGGVGNDTFAIQNAGTLSGGINGGGGGNTLDLSQKTSATIVFNQGSSSVAGVGVAGSITNVGTTIGNGLNTTLQGSNAGQSFAITGTNQITVDGAQVFQGVGNLNAGTGADSISGNIAFALDGSIVDTGGATTLSGTIVTYGSQTYNGAITAAAPLGLAAIGNILATNSANDFSTLSLYSAGAGGVAIVDANNLTLDVVQLAGSGTNSISVGTAAGSTLSRTATLLATNAPTLTVGGVVVNNGLRDLFTTGAATSVQIEAGAGGTHNVAATGVGLLPSMTVSGNLAVTGATNITQSGALSVGGTSSFNAGANAITLTAAGNDFQGVVSLTGSTTQITDANALTLGTLSTGALTAISTGALGLGQGNVGGALVATSNGGPVSQSGALTVTGASTINAGAGAISLAQGNDFQGAVGLTGGTTQITDANALTLGTLATGALTATSTGALGLGQGSVGGALVATSNGGSVSQSGALTVTGTSSVNAGAGAITLASANDFQGTVSLTGGTTQITDANALTLGTLATGALTATSTGALGLGQGSVGGALVATSNGGPVSQSGALTVTGTSSVNAGAGAITLASANDFQGAVGLAGGTTQITDANALTLGTLATGALTATATGALGLGQGSVGGALVATSNGGPVSQSGALTVTGTSSVNAGAGAITLASANDFQGAVGLAGGTTQITDANALTLGTLATGALTATATGALGLGQGSVGGALVATSNGGAVSQSGALTVTGTSSVNAGAAAITLAQANDFQGAVSLTGGTTQITDANTLTLGAVNLAAGQTFTATGSTIALTNGVTTTSDQTYVGSVALGADVTLSAGAGRIDVQGGVDGAGNDLTLTSTSAAANAIRIGGAVGNVAQFVANGRSTIGANVTTTGNQTYAGTLTLVGDAALNAGAATISLQGIDGGTRNLTLTSSNAAADAISVAGAIADAGAVTTNGRARLGGNVTTSGTQTYNGSVLLANDLALTGSTLTFNGAVDGAHALAVNGAGTTAVFNAAVGDGTALTSLSVTGPAQLNGGRITTTGSQTYANAVLLGNNTTLAGNTVSFLGTVDGAHALTVQNPGTTTFAGAVGAATPLASLATTGGGTVALSAASVETSGAQNYSGALQVNGNTRLTGGSLSFGAGVSGAQDLNLQTDALALTGNLSGTGTLTIAPRTPGLSIGLAGAAGDLQISQATLGAAAGFAQHVIGRADGSGDITSNALQLATNTTLQTGSGDIRLNGSVDGGFDLVLNSGGLTHLAGPIGTTTALRSLTTDNQAAADWNGTSGERTLIDSVDGSGRARVITTGAQTYNDPLVVLVPVQFAGGAISATNAASRFDAAVHAGAASLDLRSSQAITLGDVTLAAGGRIETDGVLELAGALVLSGGTLSLVTNATPTSVGFTDPELQDRTLSFGLVPVTEASATLFQSAGSTISSAAGSLLVLRSPNSGSMALENAGNDLRGGISAVSGPLGDNSVSRFTTLPLGFIRIASTEINAVGKPPTDGSQTLLQAGIEGDVLKLTADKITTGPDGQLRARLPFDNTQGSQTSVPGLTLIMSPTALTVGGGFGLSTPDGYIQVRIGNELGGYLTVRPRGVSGDNAFILLAGPDPKPFYDGNGKLTEVRVFYNGDAPRTPQEAGALTAVTAIVEDARQTRFEEAVRTENVKSRLRSGVIAEVGAGRPATVGRESIMMPPNCTPKAGTLQCE